jgi:hypothetical protein
MRIAATVLAVALVVSGCASRQNDPTDGVSRAAAPVKYETTVSTYFDLTSRTPPAQRKISFSPPETTNCRILASSGGHLGWVVPVMYETNAPPPLVAPVVPAKTEAPVQVAKAAPPAPKGKPAKGRQKAAAPVAAASAAAAPVGATAVAAAVVSPVGSSNDPVATLDNVSVTGKTRYFFWFDRETINAVTKRMDICP